MVVAIFNKPLIYVFKELFGAYKDYKKENDNTELLLKFEEQIKLTKQLINGNKKMQEQFDTMLSKAVTKEQIERIIYNQIQFLELKQNKD